MGLNKYHDHQSQWAFEEIEKSKDRALGHFNVLGSGDRKEPAKDTEGEASEVGGKPGAVSVLEARGGKCFEE